MWRHHSDATEGASIHHHVVVAVLVFEHESTADRKIFSYKIALEHPKDGYGLAVVRLGSSPAVARQSCRSNNSSFGCRRR